MSSRTFNSLMADTGGYAVKPDNTTTTSAQTWDTDKQNGSLSLLGSLSRVEVPFIKVKIGEFTFGVYDKTSGTAIQANEAFRVNKIKYPNFIKSLSVEKINGQVNKYTLVISYPLTPTTDPNFFEKVFSTVGISGDITFSYGDLSVPTFIYKDEEAMITNVTTTFNAKSPVITYTVSAISKATLLTSNSGTFQARYAKPSTVILDLLKDKTTGLQDIFYGMKNRELVLMNNLIAQDDKPISIPLQTNISVLEYIQYLVSSMTPISDDRSSLQKSGVYVLNVIDDVSGVFGGPYFTVSRLRTTELEVDALQTYQLDIGFPSKNVVTEFAVNNSETYSLLYDYSGKFEQEEYNYRLNDEGKFEPVYAPMISSNNDLFKTTDADRTWWTAVTSFPITATVTIKGLLRPALLMSYVRVKVYYYGKLHTSSGLYAISQQIDTIDESGFKTTLSLLRIAEDNDKNAITSFVTNSSKSSSYVSRMSQNIVDQIK